MCIVYYRSKRSVLRRYSVLWTMKRQQWGWLWGCSVEERGIPWITLNSNDKILHVETANFHVIYLQFISRNIGLMQRRHKIEVYIIDCKLEIFYTSQNKLASVAYTGPDNILCQFYYSPIIGSFQRLAQR